MKNSIRPFVCLLAMLVGVSAPAAAQEIVLQAGKATKVVGAWTKVSDSSAAAGARMSMPEKGLGKVTTPYASPANYFEMTFSANAGTAYRLWFRGKAASNSWSADSAFIQFNDSVTSSGASAFRIGSTAATTVTIEDCSGCGVSGWGWNDNYYGKSQGSLIYFKTTGTHTIRVQNREDGLSIDQIVLSPVLYRSAAPGDNKNDDTILDPATGKPTSTSSSTSTSTSTGTRLRVMHWNTHHGGVGTDGVLNIPRLLDWVVKENPDVISFNEVEKNTWWGNEDQPAIYKAYLQQKTGRTWYMVWAQEFGSWSANGKGNLLLSRYPFTNTARYLLSYSRTIALGQINVNGRNITIATTHLDPDSGTRRLAQANELTPWFKGFSQNRIVVGDTNAQPTSTEMAAVKNAGYRDAWADAKAGGYAVSAPDNPNGYTRNSRIDQLYTSTGVSSIKPKRVEVVDTRDSKGVMPSDHRPLVVDYTVN